ncbi:protein NYNRIN-like isoform X2 [Simochromis diagramma]|uniref:protein NYNRIN-like isoform X2 n=1 Tax=Simochromis diagramma TaxID=43689 RepID=UPI001A7EA573|nr:protein NYNRIN-like isoform X2 [Simochromis diagramma]
MLHLQLSPNTEHLPILEVEIDGKKYPFLVDSGATKSSLSGKFYNGPVSSVCINTMGINGTVVQCPKTHSLKTRWGSKPDEITYHPFVIIPNSPVNLLGRDLMAKMNLCISFNTKGEMFADTDNSYVFSALRTMEKEQPLCQLDASAENELNTFLSGIPRHTLCQRRVQKPLPGNPISGSHTFVSLTLFNNMITAHTSEGQTVVLSHNSDIGYDITTPCRHIDLTYPIHCTISAVTLPAEYQNMTLWSKGENDVGFIDCTPYHAQLKNNKPVYVKQYPIPSTATHFTVVDLCSAFFSVPVHEDTQPLFAFTHRNKQYTWTRLPQGMVDSPAAFSMVIRATLDSFTPPEGCTLIQYVDDLLLCAPSEELCQTATHMLLQHLQQTGHKASAKKMQYCQTSVQYLGFTLSHGKRSMTADRVKAVTSVPRPTTQKEMLSFLGMVNYCRQWIPDCSFHDHILRDCCKKDKPPRILWSTEMTASFNALKGALTSAPCLGLPDYHLPFHLYVTENGTTCTGVLAQEHGSGYRPVAFYSKVLPAVVQGMPACLRAVAACSIMIRDCEKLTLSHDTILHTNHQVTTILANITTQHMTAQRRSGYEATLTSTANLTIKASSTPNSPAHLLIHMLCSSDRQDGSDGLDVHDCITRIQESTAPRPDLEQTPIPDSATVYVDGSCSRPNDNSFLCGYSVVTLPDIILEAHSLPFHSAQKAELMALIRACELHVDRRVTIYTDSRYAFGVVHDFGTLWRQRGFRSADGKPIANSDLVKRLLQAIQLPSAVAVVKTKGHSTADTDEATGNALADVTAKAAAASQLPPPQEVLSVPLQLPLVTLPDYLDTNVDLKFIQEQASACDYTYWENNDCTLDDRDGLYKNLEGLIALPSSLLPVLVRHFHCVSHVGQRGVIGAIKSRFVIEKTLHAVKSILATCLTCARTNVGKPKAKHQHLPQPDFPFHTLQIDFTHMPAQGSIKYLLVIVDQFSKWVEAYPTSKETAEVVCQKLCNEIIPRFGIPHQINSDRGPSFTSEVIQKCAKTLGIDWKYHVPYHPQSSGVVERMNRTIKNRLTKAMIETGMTWAKLLPQVLCEIRMTPSAATKLSPFEIIMGRPFPTPWSASRGAPLLEGDIDTALSDYVHNLVETLNNNYQKVCLSQPFPSTVPTHKWRPGDAVLVKSLKPRTLGEAAFSSPQTVLAVTRTSILTDGQPQWIHASRVKTSPIRPPQASDQADDDSGGPAPGTRTNKYTRVDDISGEPAPGSNPPTHTESLINTQRLKEPQQGTRTSSRNRKPKVPHDV